MTDNPDKKTILIVDDNADNRELAVKVLKKVYETIEAVNGDQALEMAIAIKPDLILMDISLPLMDGYEVTRRLKARDDCRDIPIIALTAHAMKGDREKALSVGCCEYIAKPIKIRELPQLVAAQLRKK